MLDSNLNPILFVLSLAIPQQSMATTLKTVCKEHGQGIKDGAIQHTLAFPSCEQAKQTARVQAMEQYIK